LFFPGAKREPKPDRKIDKWAKKYESKVYMRGLAPLIYGLNLAERALFLNFVKVA
jgi:hypothetical protein